MSNKLRIAGKVLTVINVVYMLVYLCNIDYILDGRYGIIFTAMFTFALLYATFFIFAVEEWEDYDE